MDESHDDEAVDRLDRVDRVPACNRYPRLRADRFAAVQDAADHLDRQLVDRHAHQRERHDRRAAHGVHVGNGVGRRDAAEIVRVVDDRHEKVGRRNERLLVVEPVNRRVVAGFHAHQQLGWQKRRARAPQNIGQYARGDFATAASAVGK